VNTKENFFNIIVNPNAGRGKTEKILTLVVDKFRQNNVKHNVNYANTPESAQQIAHDIEISGEKNIVIIGGDGTFSEVINGLVNPENFNFGLIPAGSGNDFAKTLGISRNPKIAIKHILNISTKTIDYLQGHTRRAINTASTGIDIAIMERYNSYKKRSKFNYYKALFRTIFKHKFSKYSIQTRNNPRQDETKDIEEKEYFVIAACNGKYFGGGMKISPYSNINDGKINLICINGMRKRNIFFFRLFKFLKGKHINKPYVQEHICETATLNSGELTTVNYDGELVYNEPFDIKIIKDGLTIFFDQKIK